MLIKKLKKNLGLGTIGVNEATDSFTSLRFGTNLYSGQPSFSNVSSLLARSMGIWQGECPFLKIISSVSNFFFYN